MQQPEATSEARILGFSNSLEPEGLEEFPVVEKEVIASDIEIQSKEISDSHIFPLNEKAEALAPASKMKKQATLKKPTKSSKAFPITRREQIKKQRREEKKMESEFQTARRKYKDLPQARSTACGSKTVLSAASHSKHKEKKVQGFKVPLRDIWDPVFNNKLVMDSRQDKAIKVSSWTRKEKWRMILSRVSRLVLKNIGLYCILFKE